MAKEICISTTPHETRLAILEDDQLAEVYYERENEYTLAGSIYKGRVTRVLPGMQSSFVDVGLERDAFLYVTDFLEDQEDAEEYSSEPAAGSGAARRGREGGGAQRGSGAASQAGGEDAGGEPRRGGRQEGRERPGRERAGGETFAPGRSTAAAAVPPRAEEAPEPSEAEGEDADSPAGTRRWRGRRGRRRGVRGATARLSDSPENLAEASTAEQEAAPFAVAERGAPGGLESVRTAEVFSVETLHGSVSEPQTRAGAEGEGLRRYEGRARGGDRGEASGRGDAATLPGESLSKYGGVPQASAAPAQERAAAAVAPSATTARPRPSTLVEVQAAGWDGGAVLPGESLSRYRGGVAVPTSASAAPFAQEPAVEAHSGGAEEDKAEWAGEEHPEPGAEGTHEGSVESAHEPVGAAFHEPAAEALPEQAAEALPEPALALPEPTEPALASPEVVSEGADTLRSTVEAPEHEGGDWEPADQASASHRVLPFGTGELRIPFFSASSEKNKDREPEVAETLAPSPAEELLLPAEHEAQPFAPEATAAFGERHGGEEVYGEPAGVFDREPGEAAASLPVLHQDGTVESVEMVSSATTLLEAHGFGGAREPSDDDAPEHEHEHAAAGDGEHAAVEGQSFAQMVDRLHGYVGAEHGLLEEEELDEEEYEFEPATLSAEDDQEDLEEETLDGDEHRHQHEHAREPLAASTSQGAPPVDEAASPFSFELADEEGDDEFAEGEEEGAAAPAEGGRSAGREPRRGGSGGGRLPLRGRRDGRGPSRRSAQTQNLPVISDLLKAGQEILVQIAKEPIAKKGARITSHIALPGRFLVFMPTVHHVGVSRKIASDEERQRLKRILVHERGESSGGFIVRTAAEGTSEEELRADLRFLISLWNEIKQRADSAKAPALIYHDLNLVERILRDQVSANFSTIWVDSEAEYERIVRFLNRFQPSLVRRVKLYTKETPLFEHFGIQEEISKALKSKVWLKSGGSIVINQTEALVAIDINTGKYVGKTARLEDTIVKINLDAIPEIVRQIRLRDLGGIIVIDFIDMDERRNRQRVLQALEEELKHDRAPSKVLQFNDFGLVAITRKRVKQSLERTLSVQCNVCQGTGMVKSPVTVANEIYTEMRKMQKHLDGKDVMLRVNPEVVKQLKTNNGKWIAELEEMIGKTIIIKSDPALHPEQFDIQ